MQSLSDLIFFGIHEKRVEPMQRMVGGRFGWAAHRFPIRNGISWSDVMAKNIQANNALFRRLTGKTK